MGLQSAVSSPSQCRGRWQLRRSRCSGNGIPSGNARRLRAGIQASVSNANRLTRFPLKDTTLNALIAGFENGTWPKAQWTHSAHLALGACYIVDGSSALGPVARTIPRYNVSQGGENTEDSGYHETLTCFWHDVIRDFIATLPAGLDRLAIAREVVTEFAPRRDLFQQYYDFDIVNSREARAKWIPPRTTARYRQQSQ